MAEFILEGRDHAARAESEFVLGFIEAMFFTETGDTGADEWFSTDPEERTAGGTLPCDVGYADLHPDSLAAIRAFCEAFQRDNAEALAAADAQHGYDMQAAGRDLWFTSQGHGVGFWDRKELESEFRGGVSIGDTLSAAARYQEMHLFFGDHVDHGNAPFVHLDVPTIQQK